MPCPPDDPVLEVAAEAEAGRGEYHLRAGVIRRLDALPTQLYRLLDPTNYRRSVDRAPFLLHVLDYGVDLVLCAKTA